MVYPLRDWSGRSDSRVALDRSTRLIESRRVCEILRLMPGRSQGLLVRCDDNQLYVMKAFAPDGANALANEFMAAILLAGLGVKVPPFAILWIDPKVSLPPPATNLQGASGTVSTRLIGACHFGSRLLFRAEGKELLYSLPRALLPMIANRYDLLAVALFDLWADTRDRREFVYRRKQLSGLYDAFAIDNGECFGGSHWSDTDTDWSLAAWHLNCGYLTNDHFTASLRLFQAKIPKLLCNAIADTPKQWYTGDILAMQERFLRRVAHLSSLCQVLRLKSSPSLFG